MGPPNQDKLGGLTLRLNEADYGGDGRHPPTRRYGTGDTDGQEWFSGQRCCDHKYTYQCVL